MTKNLPTAAEWITQQRAELDRRLEGGTLTADEAHNLLDLAGQFHDVLRSAERRFRCAKHPAYEASYCPRCGSAAQIG